MDIYKTSYIMDDVIEIVAEVAEPVVDTLKDWGADAMEYVKDNAPKYLKYAFYTLMHTRW